jgi:hypothetical protein
MWVDVIIQTLFKEQERTWKTKTLLIFETIENIFQTLSFCINDAKISIRKKISPI